MHDRIVPVQLIQSWENGEIYFRGKLCIDKGMVVNTVPTSQEHRAGYLIGEYMQLHGKRYEIAPDFEGGDFYWVLDYRELYQRLCS